MASIKTFRGIRPRPDLASSIAALPFDVFDRHGARRAVEENPQSFLRIDRPETQFPEGVDMYSLPVYERARDTIREMIEKGEYVQDDKDMYYVYALTMNDFTQNGIVGCASIDDYQNGIIKKHEETREDKELDRISHIDICSAQTGPIFMAYRKVDEISNIVDEVKNETSPCFDFVCDDGVRHQVWTIDDEDKNQKITEAFAKIDSIYIADGHHRTASAVKVGLKRRKAKPDYTGEEEFNYFLSVFFPTNELKIMECNRVVMDLNGYTPEGLLKEVEKDFVICKEDTTPIKPEKKGELVVYLAGKWYLLEEKKCTTLKDPVAILDVSVLHDKILEPILGIDNPKTNIRILYIGGIQDIEYIKELADKSGGATFVMYPTSIDEMCAVADERMLMPPKSTWFEPKLRSGLFIHEIEE